MKKLLLLVSILLFVALGAGAAFASAVDNFVWVANSGSHTVSKINKTTNTVIATIGIGGVGSYPYNYGDATGYAYDMFFTPADNTPTGSNVVVQLAYGGTCTFSQVTSPGVTTVTATTEAPLLPGIFGLVGTYYNIATTATPSGTITVSFPYDATGLSLDEEQQLKLQQYDNGNWVDITKSIDTTHNIITGETTHLSYFAVTKLLDTTPPTINITSPTEGLITSQNVTLQYTVSDNVSPLADITIVGDPGGTIYTTDGTYTKTITATDKAGNTASASVSFTIDKTHPIGLWHFDEGQGTTASDSSGKGNNGTLINGPVWTTGKVGNALSFDGVDDYVNIPNSANLNPTSQITIVFWVNAPSYAYYGMMVSKKYTEQWAVMWQSVSGRIRCDIMPWFGYYGSEGEFVSNTELSLNQWHHVACTFDGTNARIYLDGVLDKTSAAVSGSISTSTSPLIIGAFEYSPEVYYYQFRGELDEVAIYDRVLSSSEVLALYQAGTVPPPPDTTPPIISSVDPANNATNVSVYTPIKVSFNEAMDKNSAQSAFSINPSVPGTFSWDGNTMIYTLSTPLTRATNYSVSIGTGAKDLALNALASSYNFSFTTDATPPTISSVDPANNATNVSVYTPIKVSFSEFMNKASAEGAFSIDPSVSGTFSWDGNTMIYVPSSPLALSTTYTVTIGTGAKDLAGNSLSSTFSFSFTTSAVALDDPSLVGLWHFDEGSGTTASDSSGKGNNGQLVNGPVWTTGKVGNALQFDGVDDYVNIPNSANLNPTSQITIDFWVNAPSYADYGMMVSKIYSEQWAVMWHGGSGRIRCDIMPWFSYSGSHGEFYSNTELSLNQWHHVACTFDGTNARIYIDGVLDKTSAAVSGSISTSTHPLLIGTFWPEVYPGVYSFRGELDEVEIYDRALTADEIKAHYKAGITPPDTTPPTITITSPSNGATNVATSAAVSVTFSEAMENTLTQNAFSISPAVSGAFSWSDNTMTYTPSVSLNFATTYNITIGTGAKDSAGNALSFPYTFSFTAIGNTSSGSNVQVGLDGTTATFSEITSPGSTTIASSETGPALLGDFRLLGKYYDVSTTATFSGTITLTFLYDDSGLSPKQEQRLKLQQYVNGSWVDITKSLDTTNNIITGETSHLSYFAVMELLDTAPPSITITSPAEGLITNQDVTLAYSVSDNISSPENISTTPASGTVYSAEGSHNVTVIATDEAGNTATKSISFTIDKTPPTITGSRSPDPNANGWNNTDVTVHFEASDALSGIDSVTPDQSLSTEGKDQSVTGTATDKAGNSASATVSGINIDKTPPLSTINSPQEKDYLCSDTLSLDFSVSDTLSGVANFSGSLDGQTVTSGQTLILASHSLGSHTLTVSASDLAGNNSSLKSTFNIVKIQVKVDKHVVPSGPKPTSTKTPLSGVEVRLYKRSDIEGAGIKPINWQTAPQIAASSLPYTSKITDSLGRVIFGSIPDNYIILAVGTSATDYKNLWTPVDAADPLWNSTGLVLEKYLQLIVKADGSSVPATTTSKAGSEILIIEPEYIEWDSTEEAYPFLFESKDSWGVDVALRPPEGYASDYRELTEQTPAYKAVQFTLTEKGSVPGPVGVEMGLKDPKGQKHAHKSQVGVRIAKGLREKKGVDEFGKPLKKEK